jgi:hypothetical protein
VEKKVKKEKMVNLARQVTMELLVKTAKKVRWVFLDLMDPKEKWVNQVNKDHQDQEVYNYTFISQ